MFFFTDVGELVEHRIHNRLIRYTQLFMGGKLGPWRRVTKGSPGRSLDSWSIITIELVLMVWFKWFEYSSYRCRFDFGY